MGPHPAGVDPACRRPLLHLLEAVLIRETPPLFEPGAVGARKGLIWGYDFTDEGATGIDLSVPDITLVAPEPGHFRWLHVNLADQWTRRWLDDDDLPVTIRALLMSDERHQRVHVADGVVAGILHDFERDFDKPTSSQMGSLTFLLTQGLMVTARLHPICCADIVRDHIRSGREPRSAGAALDLLVGAIGEVTQRISAELLATVQTAEDALLDDGKDPDARALVTVRKRSVQIHRQLTGLRGVLHRMETTPDLPEDLAPVVAKLAQQAAARDGDILELQGNIRTLREELDIQTANRTNDNLYLLSILSALVLPATLVTGFFGMNTGHLPLVETPYGTFYATLFVIGSAAGIYFWLRSRGFFKR